MFAATMESFVAPLVGGALIGGAALLLLALSGRIAGVSGIVLGLIGPKEERGWRLGFLGGLWLGGLLLLGWAPGSLHTGVPGGWRVAALAGLLVGVGVAAANGCTSGHGVCGLGRRSRRSLVAVVTFMSVAVLTAKVLRPLIGGGS